MFFVPTYALTKGISPTLSFYLVAILNTTSFAGRVIPAILSDHLRRLNMLCAAGVTSGILTLCWHQVQGNAGIIVFTAMYGFCSGAIISGSSISLASCPKDPKNFGTYTGMGIAFGGVAALIGPPISGALYDRYDGFSQVSTLCGIMSLFGGL
jgi:MFS family permease